MVLRFALVLLFFNCARTAEDTYDYASVKDNFDEWREGFSLWPSALNAAKVMRIHKRDTQIHSEGGVIVSPQKSEAPAPAGVPAAATSAAPATASVRAHALNVLPVATTQNRTAENVNAPSAKPPVVSSDKDAAVTKPTVQIEQSRSNLTVTTTAPNTIDLDTPGVVKRAVIVFGGFALLAVAYLIFKRKSKKSDTNNTHDDSNQFRYGVLRSDEQRDTMEFSRVPLTMDSDEDDDEDLEIFDLEQKKKSLSYVNLQPDDEEFVVELPNEPEGIRSQDNDRHNLLLDIEDRPNDTLINWSNK